MAILNPKSYSILPKDQSAAVDSVSAGTGISVAPNTGAVVVTNTGVTSAVAGTNIAVSGATGAVTVSVTNVSGNATNLASAAPSIAAAQVNNLVEVDGSGNIAVISTPTFPISSATGVTSYLSLSGGLTGYIEDFITTGSVTLSAATSFPGDTGWSVAPITGGTTGVAAGVAATTTQNPGQMSLLTTAVSGQGAALYKGGGVNAAAGCGPIGVAVNWQRDFWFQTPATITNWAYRGGFCISGQQVADPPTGGIWIEYDTANASSNSHFMLRTVNASTSTYTASAVTPAASTWYHARIWATVSGQINCSIGVANGVQTQFATAVATNINTASMMSLHQVLPRTTAAVSVIIDRDTYFAVTGRA